MRRITIGIAIVGVLLGACGGDESTDTSAPSNGGEVVSQPTDPALLGTTEFEQVCGGGTVSLAAPYDPQAGIAPVIVFEGEDPEYEYTSLTLPEGWQADPLSYADTQLVACLDRVSEERINVCEDYESDDFPEPFDVEVYGATWNITLYEANTGAEVATEEISADDKECPFLVFFDENEDVQREYAEYDDQFRGFVKEFVAP